MCDLPGQSRLGNAQAQLGFGNGIQLGHRGEGLGGPQVHGCPYAGKV
jgi:hypothetical protein